ncbi:uncharacterized protein SPSK_03596 [Sporothrix schenckii 1099-18]|uniref:Small subunit ribosomal protein S4e n=1 Tax=Sporothrix schenckii 1099-18 TaxID=1397361 RepID=A0A0F2M3Q5_SPOSC|nr:uncharacterized protein SPSK_03596 [Sporothrix schenckii 1099-18]KJR82791.1 hypothetical protein SPSK_03596 [Sporothrix schenckii 1099-18]
MGKGIRKGRRRKDGERALSLAIAASGRGGRKENQKQDDETHHEHQLTLALPSFRKKHQKRLSAPSHWLLDKLSGVYAPKASPGPHKSRECLPLIIFLRNRLKYALNFRETRAILQQRLIKVDHKVRTDMTYPTGFMDVIGIEKTGENFRLIYDTKGRFTVHRIQEEEAEYKLGKVRRVQLGRGGIPFLVTHDARTKRSLSLQSISRWIKLWKAARRGRGYGQKKAPLEKERMSRNERGDER